MEKCLYISVGDLVSVLLDHHSNAQPREAEILEVHRRYGRVNMGRNKQNPLLKGRFLDTGKEEYFDNGYVVSIIKKSSKPQLQPINIYRDPVFRVYVRTSRSTLTGSLIELTSFGLAKVPFVVEREICYDRLQKLYDRQRAGLISKASENGITRYTVKRDLFLRWVRKNYTQIILTVKELADRETEQNTEYERSYWRDVDRGEQEWDSLMNLGLLESSEEPDWNEPGLEQFVSETLAGDARDIN